MTLLNPWVIILDGVCPYIVLYYSIWRLSLHCAVFYCHRPIAALLSRDVSGKYSIFNVGVEPCSRELKLSRFWRKANSISNLIILTLIISLNNINVYSNVDDSRQYFSVPDVFQWIILNSWYGLLLMLLMSTECSITAVCPNKTGQKHSGLL